MKNIQISLDPPAHEEEHEGWDLPTRIPHSMEQCEYSESKYNTREMQTNKTNTNEMNANEKKEIIFDTTETLSRLGDKQRIMREIRKQ